MKTTPESSQQQQPAEIQKMFNAIAPTYDALNHLLSFGLDIRWRRKAIRLLQEKRGGVFLDIASGSGDVSFDLLDLDPKLIVGSDFAMDMLHAFRQKIAKAKQSVPIKLVSCDALSLPFKNGTFDGTIAAFGIRNFADRLRSLHEMRRVLKPNGVSIILELTSPRTPIVSQLYRLYSNVGLPLIGKIISKHNSAYSYLPKSIAAFPEQEGFLSLMSTAGFSEAFGFPLTFGIATIFVGKNSSLTL